MLVSVVDDVSVPQSFSAAACSLRRGCDKQCVAINIALACPVLCCNICVSTRLIRPTFGPLRQPQRQPGAKGSFSKTSTSQTLKRSSRRPAAAVQQAAAAAAGRGRHWTLRLRARLRQLLRHQLRRRCRALSGCICLGPWRLS
jgi:hypothetical protein